MASIIDYLIILVTSFGFNMIPFAGPSNLFIASTAAIGLTDCDATTLIIIGILVAIGATLAKGIHYLVTFFIGKRLNEKRRQQLDSDAAKVRKWAFPLLYIAAASPVPDEPIIIPLGLMKYSPAKFALAYFLGKITITVAGAFLGNIAGGLFSNWISQEVMIVASIVLTIIATLILFKVDLGKFTEKYLKKKQTEKPT